MPKADPIQTAFNAGEWTDFLEGRVYLAGYPAACYRVRNMIPMIQGPARRRGGSMYVRAVKNSSDRTWLVPFQRARNVAYMLEFGGSYVRFYFNRALVLTGSTATISGITKADPAVVTTSGSHGYSDGQDVYITGVSGMTEVNGRWFKVANKTSTTFELQNLFGEDIDADALDYASAGTGGTVDIPYEIASPYSAAALVNSDGEFNLDITQSADVLYICDRAGVLKPRKLSRTSSTAWAFSTLDPSKGPFADLNTTDAVMNIGAASGTGVSLQASSAVFTSDHVGALVRIEQENITATDPWKASEAYSAGDYVRSEGLEYLAANSGTSGATIPSHTNGTVSDGVVDWTYQASTHGVARITAVDSEGDLATVDVLTTFPQTAVLKTGDLSGSALNISAITKANPGVVTTSGSHGFSDGDVVYITGAGGMTEVNGRWFKITSASGSTFSLQDMSGAALDTTNYTTFTSGGTVDEIGVDDYEGQASTLWRFGAWSDVEGYPTSVAFFGSKDRLGFAKGQTDYLSVSSDFENFSPDEFGQTVPDSAVQVTLQSELTNDIVGMIESAGSLLVYTGGAVFSIGPLTNADPFGPENIDVQPRSSFGSKPIPPIRVSDKVISVQSSGRKVRELGYSIETDSLNMIDLSVRSEHLLRPRITGTVFQQEPDMLLWATTSTGALLALTYDPTAEARAWAKYPMGGSFSGGDAVVESFGVISAPDGTRDDLWLLVKRTINSATVRYVEYITPGFETGDAQEDAFFVDSGSTYDGSAATVIRGADHLEGEAVTILADGAVRPSQAVADGSITLTLEGSVVHLGFAMPWQLATMKIEAGSATGTAQGKKKKLRAKVRVKDTFLVDGGFDESDVDRIPELNDRSPATLMGSGSDLKTGDYLIDANSGWDTEGRIWLSGSGPLPVTIIAIMPRVTTSDDN